MALTKKLLLSAVFWAISTLALGQEAGWITTDEGCELWNPKPEPNETVSWNGPCVDGVAQGYGTVIWFKGGLRNGELEALHEKGVRKGIVKYTHPDGRTYKGFTDDKGLRHGYGVLTDSNGVVQSGNWEHNKLITNNPASSSSVNGNGSHNWKPLGDWADKYLEQERRNRGTTCSMSIDGRSWNCK